MEMRAAAFAPAHITGFFSVRPDPDPLRAGSAGCGLCLESGVTASITGSSGGTVIRINGEQVDFPTVEYAARAVSGARDLVVDLRSDVPVGYGFGVSGAAALAAALAIGSALDLGPGQLAGFAHTAEVVNRTGMGDVAGQCTGGLAVRKEAGAPGIGVTEQIPVGVAEVSWVCLGKVSTASVLDDEGTINSINELGEMALRSFLKKPGLERFMSLSKEFAIKTGLISNRALDAVEAVETQGGRASMAMLGDTVFSIGGADALAEFGEVGRSRIGFKGAHYPGPQVGR